MTALDRYSKQRLDDAHPLLKKLFNIVHQQMPIKVLQSQRGKADQERAVKEKRSTVHFGQSAHNWSPALALDICPLPIDWNNRKPFIELGQKIVLPLAHELKIPIRWGADFNMNDNYTDDHFVDLPHYELFPWREWAKQATLYKG